MGGAQLSQVMQTVSKYIPSVEMLILLLICIHQRPNPTFLSAVRDREPVDGILFNRTSVG